MIQRPLLALCLVLGLAGCGRDPIHSRVGGGGSEGEGEGEPAEGEGEPAEGEGEPSEGEGEGADPFPDLPDRCTDGTRWTPGTPAYEEATAAWGLLELEVQGVRISATDIDGDGFTDLLVRGGLRLLRNTGEGRFEDVTEASGIVTPRAGGEVPRPGQVVASADVDNDGDLDVYTGCRVSDPGAVAETSELMLNEGDGTFAFGPEDSAARRADYQADPAGAAFVDFDRDGAVDLWVAHNKVHEYNPMPDDLFQGDGGGGFADVTMRVGIVTLPWAGTGVGKLNDAEGNSWAWSAAACDLNGDGVPELLASSYGRAPNHLWQGELRDGGAVRYLNRSVVSGYAYDDRQDWTDNLSAQCHCLDHPDDDECDRVEEHPSRSFCDQLKASLRGSYRWAHSADREPWRLGGNSGTTVCADVDNDGWIDLLTSEIVHPDVGSSSDPAELLFNTGEMDVTFERPGNETTGLVRPYLEADHDEGIMTATVLDFDNDAWPDVYLGVSDYPYNRGHLYHQEAAREFVDLPLDDFFEHKKSHGVVAADLDRDGDLDLVVGHSRSRCNVSPPDDCYETTQMRLFENTLGERGNWVQLDLEGGEGTNRAAIGARVTVTAGGVTQTQEVDGGHGHYGTQKERVLHFGLGAACEAEVEVRWPDADLTTERVVLPTGYRFHLVQGEAPEVVTE